MSSRWTLADVATKSPEVQRQVAAALWRKATPSVRTALSIPAGIPPVIPCESDSQIALFKWWSDYAHGAGIDERLLMAFPLQGVRTKASGGRLKAEGMRAGTPDMFLAIGRGQHGGLWIEMKTYRAGSKLSQPQKWMLKILSTQYATVVCRSTDEARHALLAYLRIESPQS